ncbi:MAG: LysE family translocator [Rhodospirillaceae bacterium]
MIDTSALLAVYAAFIVGLISPGPDLILVTAISLKHGRKAAILSSVGIGIGVGFWALAAAIGLAEVINTVPEAWQGMRLLAGGALIYMGARGISSSMRGTQQKSLGEPLKNEGAPILSGLITNIANPKAAIVLIGLTTVLSDNAADSQSVVAAVVGMPCLTVLWFTAVSVFFTGSRVIEIFSSNQRVLDMVGGIALAGVGAILIQTV